MRKIQIDVLSSKSIEEAKKEIQRYADDLKRAEKSIESAVADVGMEVAREGFSAAQYAGYNDVSVSVRTEDDETQLAATGEAVAFIEFGTGVVMGQGETLPRPPGLAGLGQYGQGKGATPPWGYYGVMGINPPEGTYRPERKDVVITKGNPPAGAMLRASEEMRSRKSDIVRKELGKL